MRDEPVPGVLVEIGVGLGVGRIFDMRGPTRQGVVHIPGDLRHQAGLNIKHRRDARRPFRDDLGRVAADEGRQLGPQRVASARPGDQRTAAHIVCNPPQVGCEWLFKKRHTGLLFPLP